MKQATATRELTQLDSLHAQIRVSETWQGRSVTDAEARSQAMFNCPIDSLTTEQAYEVLKAQAAERPPQGIESASLAAPLVRTVRLQTLPHRRAWA